MPSRARIGFHLLRFSFVFFHGVTKIFPVTVLCVFVTLILRNLSEFGDLVNSIFFSIW